MTRLLFWVVVAMAMISIAINLLFPLPSNVNEEGSSLTRYFNYGRSIESKVLYAIGDKDENSSPLAKAGWFEKNDNIEPLTTNESTQQRVFVYGMSFSNHIAERLAKLDNALNVKTYSGPGAPLNHSYAYYLQTRPHKEGDIVVLGVLASAMVRMNSLTSMTPSFESPPVNFYPKYSLDQNRELVSTSIDINSLSELRSAIHNETVWKQVKATLAKEDKFYDEWLFTRSIQDKWVYLNLIRRAWGQVNQRDVISRYHDNSGFKNHDQLIDVSHVIIKDFVEQVRKDKAIPYIILFNDGGYSDDLYKIMKPVLDEEKVPYYSTHLAFPAQNLANFIPDGHFTPQVDDSIAESVLEDIHKLRH